MPVGLHKRALAITLLSLALWTGWNYGRELCHPFADLSCGFFTDHFSHVALARIAVEVGPDIYRTARGNLAEPLTEQEKEALPPDLENFPDPLSVEGWPADKPFTSTWLDIPSFYPPGELLLFTPATAAYSFTDISFTEANRLTIQLLLAYAHIALYLMIALSLGRSAPEPESILVLVLAYLMVIHWTLEGFYEGAWIAPLLLTPFYLARREAVPALFTFTLSAFAHFRALFYLPWAAESLFRFGADRHWRSPTRRQVAALSASVLMGAASLWTFLVIMDAMTAHRMTNHFNPASEAFDRSGLLTVGLIVALAGFMFIYQGAWRELIMLLWVGTLIALLPEVNHWEAVALVPWLLAAVNDPEGDPRIVKQTRIAAAILLIALVFPQSLQLDWLKIAIDQFVS